MAPPVQRLGTRRVKPSVYFKPTAQPTSKSPAMISTIQAMVSFSILRPPCGCGRRADYIPTGQDGNRWGAAPTSAATLLQTFPGEGGGELAEALLVPFSRRRLGGRGDAGGHSTRRGLGADAPAQRSGDVVGGLAAPGPGTGDRSGGPPFQKHRKARG